MDDTSPDLGPGKDSADCLLKTAKPIDAEEQYIIYPTIFQII